MVFKQFNLKLDKMRKAQDFLIYPYDGGETVLLQSDTRIMRLELKTGKALLSKSHSGGSYAPHLNALFGAYDVQLNSPDLKLIQGYLWENSGTQSNKVLSIENKELFSQ